MTTESAIEGLLFAMGEAVPAKDLAQALQISDEEVRDAAERLARDLKESERGIRLIRLGDSYQLGSCPNCFEALIRLAAHPKKPALTNVMLETLTIIAYRQPVTKMEISKIRGVSSDHAVNRLIEYGLVCEAGRLDAPGRPILLKTTEEFLRRFGLSSAEDLPDPSAEKMAELEEEAEEESAEQENQVPVNV